MAFRWHPALGFMICLLATASVAAQDSPPLTTRTIDQPLHFLSKGGGDIHSVNNTEPRTANHRLTGAVEGIRTNKSCSIDKEVIHAI